MFSWGSKGNIGKKRLKKETKIIFPTYSTLFSTAAIFKNIIFRFGLLSFHFILNISQYSLWIHPGPSIVSFSFLKFSVGA